MNKLKFETANVLPAWEDAQTESLTSKLNQKYQSYLTAEWFSLESSFNSTQIQLKTTLNKRDGSWSYPVELVHVREQGDELTVPEIAGLLLDFADVYWNEYLTNERDVYVNLDWTSHKYEEHELFIRGFVRNLGLENQADALLKEHGFGAYDIDPISSET